MNKKAQVSFFLIAALVLVIGVVGITYLNVGKQNTNVPKTDAISLFVRLCIEKVGKDAAGFNALQGGYYNIPKLHTYVSIIDVPYYFYENYPSYPSKDTAEKELGLYVDKNLNDCLGNFTELKNQGYQIEPGSPKTKATISGKNINFEVDMPLTSKYSGSSQTLNTFSGSVPIRYGSMLELVDSFEQDQMKSKDSICISCLLDLNDKYNVRIVLNRLDNSSILFSIVDNSTLINQKPLYFNFAHKYREVSCSKLPSDDVLFVQQCLENQIKLEAQSKNVTLGVELGKIPDMQAKVGAPFSYIVNAKGIGLTYKDYTNLFDINPKTGKISFTPKESDKGNHTVWIGAKNKLGNEDYASFILSIGG